MVLVLLALQKWARAKKETEKRRIPSFLALESHFTNLGGHQPAERLLDLCKQEGSHSLPDLCGTASSDDEDDGA